MYVYAHTCIVTTYLCSLHSDFCFQQINLLTVFIKLLLSASFHLLQLYLGFSQPLI